MEKYSYHALRLSLALTFLMIGWYIWQEPLGWATFLDPWAQHLAQRFLSLEALMRGVAIFDMLLGILLLTNRFMKIAGYLVAFHMIGILVMGVNETTVRDIGLLGAGIALAWWPHESHA